MRPRALLTVVVILAMAGVCVRLGFWQIARLREKQATNAASRAALAAPPVAIGAEPPDASAVSGRKVRTRGRFDETRQVLLSARSNAGSPGIDVVTPLVLAGGSRAILVDRGWLYAGDAATARPEDCPEPGERTVLGLAEPLSRGRGGAPLRVLEADSVTLYSARWLDADSLAGRFPYALAPFFVRQLPGPGVPDRPLRRVPQPQNEMMHVSYAVQWFLFAAIVLGGSAILAWSRRHGAPNLMPKAGS